MIWHNETIKPYVVEGAHLIGRIVVTLVLKNLLEARNESSDVSEVNREQLSLFPKGPERSRHVSTRFIYGPKAKQQTDIVARISCQEAVIAVWVDERLFNTPIGGHWRIVWMEPQTNPGGFCCRQDVFHKPVEPSPNLSLGNAYG